MIIYGATNHQSKKRSYVQVCDRLNLYIVEQMLCLKCLVARMSLKLLK